MTPDERDVILNAMPAEPDYLGYLFDVWMERIMVYAIAPVFVLTAGGASQGVGAGIANGNGKRTSCQLTKTRHEFGKLPRGEAGDIAQREAGAQCSAEFGEVALVPVYAVFA